MSLLKIYDDSTNYTCQVIKLPTKIPVKGLDNLVEVNYQGNACLVGKDSPEDELFLFFPVESQISHDFLNKNNLYRHPHLNSDPNEKGFFEDSRRVKAIKFKGVISSGFIIPLNPSLFGIATEFDLKPGDEFNEFNGYEVCRKYMRRGNRAGEFQGAQRLRILDEIVDSKQAPEHPDTGQLLKNAHRLNLNTRISVSYKLHGTSGRVYNSLIKKKLTWKEKLAQFFGVKVEKEYYGNIAASRRVVKSVDGSALPGKAHYYETDLYTQVMKEQFEGKLNKGEAVYFEIVGKTYTGELIQKGYTYTFDTPEVFVYRISNINPQGIEIDLTDEQVSVRAEQLGLKVCPNFFRGTLGEFIEKYDSGQTYVDFEEPLTRIFYKKLLEQPSILDSSVVEEGFCVRIDEYPKPTIFKIKSKKFLLHESKAKDEDGVDMEENQDESNGSSEENTSLSTT